MYKSTPTAEHIGTLIFLHGRGDTGRGWFEILKDLVLNVEPGIKIICPSAPTRSIAYANGQKMPAWHNLENLNQLSYQELPGINDSCSMSMFY